MEGKEKHQLEEREVKIKVFPGGGASVRVLRSEVGAF
jgi:hypothetical protein